jgi:flagellar biosynthesis protein FlhB
MSEQDDEDKTEEPTERKLQKAYERGDVPKSMELNTFFVLGGATLMFFVASEPLSRGMTTVLRGMLSRLHEFSFAPGGMTYTWSLIESLLLYVISPLLILVFAAIAAGLVQHQLIISTESMAPKLERISPLAGFKRLFGLDAWVMFFKGIAKTTLVAVVMFIVIQPETAFLADILQMSTGSMFDYLIKILMKVLASVLLAFTFIAVFAAFFQRLRWHKRQRMTLKEIKDEMKETDGNPEIKAKIRQLRIARARNRMMSKIPEATVVITNPTHYAVALKYEPGMVAPVCLAKGLDRVALRIRSLAEENRIAVVENPPLARALHKQVELEEEIPPEHYKAVAEVIGYVMRMKDRRFVS